MKPVIPDLFGAFSGFTSRIEGLDQLERVRRGMWVHSFTPRPPVGQTPHEVMWRHDKMVVRYYVPPQATKLAPVVLVPSMINRAYILDLEPGRSLVQALSHLGHPTYLIDWGTPGPEDAKEDVGYVLFELLHRAIDRICRHGKTKTVHLFGYCMGGTIAAMYAALRPGHIRSLCTLAAPVKFSEGGRFRDFVAPL
ncbi:MAG: alpha/beta fold hydrolase, partial [Proteobacteria bacterium]|nr:alpha/beta fold hydrolase [Pseudomonadota bacterium]